MKFDLRGCLRLKPFDEGADAAIADGVYSRSAVLTIAVLIGACLAIAAFALVLVSHPAAPGILALAVGVSAVTAGLEWHAGLKARALNHLIVAVLAALAFWGLSLT